jgi:hypothetical protein
MGDLQNLLPHWFVAAALPSVALITFFWKGDDALSSEFKAWLAEHIVRLNVGSPGAGIEPLGLVFDLVYGKRWFTLLSFFRVAGVSTIAAVISFIVATYGYDVAEALRGLSSNVGLLVGLASVNIVFDYISVTKARFILQETVRREKLRFKSGIFLCIDALITTILVVAYIVVVRSIFIYAFPPTSQWSFLGMFGYFFLIYSFGATTFLIFFITCMYLLSLWSLIFIGAVPALSFMLWILPIKQLPIRSIGVMSGTILFVGLNVFNLVRNLWA